MRLCGCNLFNARNVKKAIRVAPMYMQSLPLKSFCVRNGYGTRAMMSEKHEPENEKKKTVFTYLVMRCTVFYEACIP
jgi:hypothetical protein